MPSPRAVRDLVPEAVDAAVQKAMATLPADRFATAAQFAEALGTPATVAIAVGAAQAMVQEVIGAAKSVAVLPFENMSTDPENEYFSDGITDDIIAQLSKISALKVISRTSSMQYKKTTKKIAAIAQELGVGAVLEGSVRRAGQRVRIVVHLVEPRTEKHLWGETFDRQLSDIFEVQSEVAQQITGALSVALSPEEKQRVEKKATGDADAYNLYLLGRFHANKWSGEDVQQGHRVLPAGHREGPGLCGGLRRPGRRLRAAQHRVRLQAARRVPGAGEGDGAEGARDGRQPRRGTHVAGVRPLARGPRLVRRASGSSSAPSSSRRAT